MVYVEGGLWGCIVVMSAFFIKVVTFGTSLCIGVYNVEFLDHFQTSATAVSLVGSINLGLFLGAGPLASIMMTRWSCRQIALTGAAISSIGVLTMPFAPNLQFMYVFYGLLSGLGYCLLYVPSHVLSGLYFYKQRSIATGIVTAGSGLGTSIFPILLQYLIEHYGWRGSFYIVAGLNLHTFVFAALLRPVPKDLEIQLKRKESADINKLSTGYRPETDLLINATNVVQIEKPVRFIEVKQRKNTEKDYEHHDDIGIRLVKMNSDNETNNENIDTGKSYITDDNMQTHLKRNEKMDVHSDEKEHSSDKKKIKLAETIRNHFSSVFTFDFLVFCLSNIFWNAGFAILLVFLPKYMNIIGLNKEKASRAFTAVGIGMCSGSFSGGLLGNIKYFNRITLYIMCNFGIALTPVLMVIGYFHTLVGMFFLSLIHGFLVGCILGLLVVITSDLLGTESLGDGFGYLMFTSGGGLFLGPPIAGVLMDATSDLSTGLYVSGLIAALGGLFMFAVPIRRKVAGFFGISTDMNMEYEIEIE